VCCILISTVAEQTLLSLRKIAEARSDVHCIAISHSDKASTDKWLQAVGGAGNVEIIVDHERKLYGQYGLGVSSAWHVLSPWSMGDVFKLARNEKIVNRPTESGTRWQTAGTFAVDASGEIQYVQVATQASDNGNFEKALKSLGKP
jgi:peroxiredoxin